MAGIQIWESLPFLRLAVFHSGSRHHRGRWHSHPFYEAAVVMSGSCAWRLGHRLPVVLHAGEALLLPPGVRHRDWAGPENARLAWLGFDLAGPIPRWCRRPLVLGEHFAEIVGYYEAMSREPSPSGARSRMRIQLVLRSLVLLLEIASENKADKRPEEAVRRKSNLNPRQTRTVESAAHYFQGNLQRPLTIVQVAGYHSLCPAHFSMLFQRHHGVTPRRFLQEVRLRRVVERLAGSDLTIKEIAAECGFADAAHLCKSFKKEHGVPPNAFRKNPVSRGVPRR